MTETRFTSAPLSLEDETRYRATLSRAKASVPARPTGPPRSGMPTFQAIEESKHRATTPPGMPSLSAEELEKSIRRPAIPGSPVSRESLDGVKAMSAAMVAAKEPKTAEAERLQAPKAEVPDVHSGGKPDPDDATFLQLAQDLSPKGAITQVYDDARRKRIESQLDPISIGDLLINHDARQAVEVAPGIPVTYRSRNGLELNFVEQYIWDRFHGELTRDMYNLSKGLCALVLSVVSVGQTQLPEHRGSRGEVDIKNFENKWQALLRYPAFLLEAMDINRTWFEERCAQVLSLDSLGNG